MVVRLVKPRSKSQLAEIVVCSCFVLRGTTVVCLDQQSRQAPYLLGTSVFSVGCRPEQSDALVNKGGQNPALTHRQYLHDTRGDLLCWWLEQELFRRLVYVILGAYHKHQLMVEQTAHHLLL